MDPDARMAIVVAGLLFCLVFAFLTVSVVAQSGFDILALASFAVIVLVGAGLIAALRNPPRR